jgi:hypothetical protein
MSNAPPVCLTGCCGEPPHHGVLGRQKSNRAYVEIWALLSLSGVGSVHVSNTQDTGNPSTGSARAHLPGRELWGSIQQVAGQMTVFFGRPALRELLQRSLSCSHEGPCEQLQEEAGLLYRRSVYETATSCALAS